MFLLLLKLLVCGFPPVNFLLSKVSGSDHTQLQPNGICTMIWYSQNEIFCLVFIFPFPFFLSYVFGYRNTLHRSLWGLIMERLQDELHGF